MIGPLSWRRAKNGEGANKVERNALAPDGYSEFRNFFKRPKTIGGIAGTARQGS